MPSGDRILRVIILGDAKSAEASLTGLSGRLKMFRLGAATALAGAAAASVDMASKYQTSMKLIQTQAGASAAEVRKMSAAVLTLGGKVGSTPIQLSDALYHIESTGARGAKALNELKIAAEGAKIGQADLTDVTNALNSVMVSHIAKNMKMKQAMGELNAVVGAGDMHMQDLAEALGGGLTATMKLAGVHLDEMGAALAVFGDNNLRGAGAATALRMAVQGMLKPSTQGAAALAKLHISADELRTTLAKKGLSATLADLHGKLVKFGGDKNTWNGQLIDAFTKRSGTGLSMLMGQYTRYTKKQEEVRAGGNRFNKDWAETQKNFGVTLDKLKASLEALAIKVGTALLPPLTKLGNWMVNVGVPALVKVTNYFENNKTAAIALGAAILTMVSPWLTLGVAIVALYKKSATFREIVHGAIMAVIAVFHALEAAGKSVFRTLSGVWQAFANGPLGYLKARFADFSQFWHSHSEEIKTITKRIWNNISTMVKDDWHIIMAVLRPGLVLLKAIFRTAWDAAKTIVKTAFQVFADTFKTGEQFILDFVGVVLDILTGKWGKAWNDAKKLVSDAIHNIGKTLTDWGKGALTLLYQVGRDMVQGLINGIKSMAMAPVNAVKGIAGGIKHEFTSGFGIFSPSRVMKQYGMFIVQGLAIGITKNASKADKAAHDLAVSIRKAVVNAANEAVKSGELVLKAKGTTHILSAVGEVVGKLKTIMQDDKGAGNKDPFIKSIQARIAAIQSMQNAVDKLKGRLSDSEKALKATQSAANQFRSSVKSSLAGGFSLDSLADTSSGAGIAASMSAQVGPMAQFLTDIKRLRKLHLNRSMLSQIINAGPGQGDQWAQELLSDTSVIGQINSAQRQLASLSSQVAKTGSDALYADQIKREREDIHRQTKALEHAVEVLQKVANQSAHQINIEINGHKGDARELAKTVAEEVRRELIKIKHRNGGKSGV